MLVTCTIWAHGLELGFPHGVVSHPPTNERALIAESLPGMNECAPCSPASQPIATAKRIRIWNVLVNVVETLE